MHNNNAAYNLRHALDEDKENQLLTLFTLGRRIMHPLPVDERPVFDVATGTKKNFNSTICEYPIRTSANI